MKKFLTSPIFKKIYYSCVTIGSLLVVYNIVALNIVKISCRLHKMLINQILQGGVFVFAIISVLLVIGHILDIVFSRKTNKKWVKQLVVTVSVETVFLLLAYGIFSVAIFYCFLDGMDTNLLFDWGPH